MMIIIIIIIIKITFLGIPDHEFLYFIQNLVIQFMKLSSSTTS